METVRKVTVRQSAIEGVISIFQGLTHHCWGLSHIALVDSVSSGVPLPSLENT